VSKCESCCFRCSLSFLSCPAALSLFSDNPRQPYSVSPTISGGSHYSQFSLVCVYMLQATSLLPSHTLPAHLCCTPHPYSALNSQNLRACSCALFSLALLVKPDQVSLGRHPFSCLQGTHPLQHVWTDLMTGNWAWNQCVSTI